jgi:outer membrane protein assembly factor BamB
LTEGFPGLAGFGAGSMLAGYRLEAQVGAGGMAVVFRARDQRLDRPVALKLLAAALASDGEFRRRFIAESRAAARVDDPHIIPVYEAGEAGGVLFIAMRFVTGGDLRGVLAREGPLLPGRAAEFISPVASALDAAHRAGLVHRDVKPANILVDESPDRPDHVYLSDFGISKTVVSSVSLTGQFLGTPDYSAPEQIQGRAVDGRADQYALACLAYQLLTGRVPFERDQPMAVLLAHLSEPPPSLRARRPDLPAAADEVLAKGMAKAPEDRYGSCRDFADALREALGLAPYRPRGPVVPDHPPTEVVSPPPRFPGPDAPGGGTAAIPADPAAATLTAAAAMVYPVTKTAVPPVAASMVPPVTKTAPAPARDDHPPAGARSPGPGPGVKAPRAARPRRADREIPRQPEAAAAGQLRWTCATGGAVFSSPAVADGTVYVGSHDGKVYALDAATGHPRWTHTTGGAVNSSPAVADGTVYVGSDDHQVYALDAATGHLRWTYTTPATVSCSPAVAGGTVYVGSGKPKVFAWCRMYALEAATGQVRWDYTSAGVFESSPAVAGGTVYVGSGDHKVHALDAATGRTRWSYLTGGIVFSSPAVAGGTVYVGSHDGKVYALDADRSRFSGRPPRWTHNTGRPVRSSPAVADGTVYVGSDDGKVHALDAATGRTRWSYTTRYKVVSSPAVADGAVYVGIGDQLYALDAATGQVRWSYTTGGAVNSSPAAAGGAVYIGSGDSKVYALSAGS